MDDFWVWCSREKFPGHYSVIKWGFSDNVDTDAPTDIYDLATDGQLVFVAPTIARKHNIASASADDDGSPAGVGAWTIRVWGLTSWVANEDSEVITMNGVADVETIKSYVIIHRLEALTWGASGPNVGDITATAQTDNTKTARILAGKGQTKMAIRGIPSTQDFEMAKFWASLLKSGGQAGAVDIRLLINPIPADQLTGFISKHGFGLSSTGTSTYPHEFRPTLSIPGPAIVKLQGVGSALNLQVEAGFDGVLIDN